MISGSVTEIEIPSDSLKAWRAHAPLRGLPTRMANAWVKGFWATLGSGLFFWCAVTIGEHPFACTPTIFGRLSILFKALSSLKPFQREYIVPPLPMETMNQSGTPNCSTTSKAIVF